MIFIVRATPPPTNSIFIDIIAPKWIRALLKLAYFLSRDLSSTPGYLA